MSETTVESGYEAVKVRIENLHELAGMKPAAPSPRKRPTYHAHYETFVLTANDPVQCILPSDPDRVIAHVIPLDNDIVIGTKGQVQSTQNTVASVPQPIGTLVPAKTTAGAASMYPVLDNDAVYAGATTTGSSSRVSVSATYRDG